MNSFTPDAQHLAQHSTAQMHSTLLGMRVLLSGSTALFGLQYELQSDHGAPGVWQTIYTGTLCCVWTAPACCIKPSELIAGLRSAGATPSCISTPLAPVAKIQFRVRGVSPITQPGPWATLELRRRQVGGGTR